MVLAILSSHWKHLTFCSSGWYLLFQAISHCLLTEILKFTIYIQIYFSFPKDGPEFMKFPVFSLYFALFVHANYFSPVANLFFFSFLWNCSPFLCWWCCSTMYYLHISLVYKIYTKLLINEWSQDHFQGNLNTDCLQLNASTSSTAYFHNRTLA